jgi:hypothetical protein
MRKGRIPTGPTLMIAGVALLIVAIPGLWVFVSVTATPLYPNPEAVPTVAYAATLPKWAGVVEKTRQIVRALYEDHKHSPRPCDAVLHKVQIGS